MPELPVFDVERAQRYYRDVFGFEIGWREADGNIGAVSCTPVAIFFRKRSLPFEPAVHWVFVQNLDGMYEDLIAAGAIIADPLERKPWGLRQFTVKDPDENLFHFHNDA